MAKEQTIKTFKDGSKLYVVIENPSKEVESQINSLFGGIAGDLATILKPEVKPSTKELAKEIDTKLEPVEETDKASEVIKATQDIINENLEGVTTSHSKETPLSEPKTDSDYPEIKDKAMAQQIVLEMLESGNHNKRKLIYVFCPQMKNKLMSMSDEEVDTVFETQKFLERAIKFSGFNPNKSDSNKGNDNKEINWV